jgi:sterol desaturase/sphingolipid hydroxylase (fatty acid hydroxylase superfamily)
VVEQWQQLLATLPNRLFGLSIWLLMMAALLIPLERRWPLHRQAVIRPQFTDDLVYFFLGGIVPAFVVVAVVGVSPWLQQYGPTQYYAWLASLPFAVRAALTVVTAEVVFYWWHRWSHEWPWLWRFHAIHHSPVALDWLVNTRAHPLDLAFSRIVSTVVLACVGLAYSRGSDLTALLAVVVIFNTSWGFFIHSNLCFRLGLLEHLITTPAFHHWHHSNDGAAVVNKNYAGLFPWVDRLFGTHYLPPGSYPRRYGIDMPMPASLAGQLLLPLYPSNEHRA